VDCNWSQALGSRPAGDWSRKPSGRLPLISARPVVTFPVAEVTTLWRIPNYTAWLQRHMCLNNLCRVVTWWWNGRSRTHDLVIAGRTSNHYNTTMPHSKNTAPIIFRGNTDKLRQKWLYLCVSLCIFQVTLYSYSFLFYLHGFQLCALVVIRFCICLYLTKSSTVQVRGYELIYDFCWYPHMSSAYPETCCMVSTSRDNPIQLWDSLDGLLRCTYRAYNDLVQWFFSFFSRRYCMYIAWIKVYRNC